MESVTKIIVFGQKMTVKSALDFFLNSDFRKIIFTDFIRFLLKITNYVREPSI